MKLHLATSAHLIRAIGPNGITVGERSFATSIIISPQRIIPDWRPRMLAELSAQDLELVVAEEPEVVVLGTGNALSFPDAEVTAPLLARRIGVEIMDTGAACRTYNILVAEGREVVAALLWES